MLLKVSKAVCKRQVLYICGLRRRCDTADVNAVELARYFITEKNLSEAVIPELIAAETGRLSGNLKMVKGDISVMNVPRQLAALVEGLTIITYG